MSDTTVDLLAGEATSARWAGDADTHPLNCRCGECIGDET